MRKFLCALSALFMLVSCGENNKTIDGHTYKLLDAVPGAEINISFDGTDQRFFGKSAVNRYFGTYKLESDKIMFGAIGSTMMAGPENMMKAESDYLQFLDQVKTFRLKGNRLILNKENGDSLTFEQTENAKSE